MEVERLVLLSRTFISKESNIFINKGQTLSTDINLGIFFKKPSIRRNDEHALMISTLLEAIFLHGFQEHGVKVMS